MCSENNPTIYDYDDSKYYVDDDNMIRSYEGDEVYYPDGTEE